MNKLKKYIVCEKEIGLEEQDSLAIIEAQNEGEAFELFIKKKGIYNKTFLCNLDMILMESFMINKREITKEYKEELLDYFEGNKEWYSCILDIYQGKGKRIYNEVTEELNYKISEDMLMFIYRKENLESMLVIDMNRHMI